MNTKKSITVVSGCYNEEDNLDELLTRVWLIASDLPQYEWDYIIIDNNSSDRSEEILRQWAAKEPRLKVILNTRNFGHIRSPFYGMIQSTGDAMIYLASDLQDPPELIKEFVKKWEEGWKIVAGIKSKSEESPMFFAVRKAYYRLIGILADVDLLKDFTGFGLYDKVVVDHLRQLDDPYPYHRGIVSELGYPVYKLPFLQPRRKRGFSKNNFYTMYDIAMLGFTNHTKIPLRFALMLGIGMSGVCLCLGLVYLIMKLIFWDRFAMGTAPVVVGLFFIGSVQLLFLGVLGEYIGAIYTKVSKRPLVVERERINFPKSESP